MDSMEIALCVKINDYIVEKYNGDIYACYELCEDKDIFINTYAHEVAAIITNTMFNDNKQIINEIVDMLKTSFMKVYNERK